MWIFSRQHEWMDQFDEMTNEYVTIAITNCILTITVCN